MARERQIRQLVLRLTRSEGGGGVFRSPRVSWRDCAGLQGGGRLTVFVRVEEFFSWLIAAGLGSNCLAPPL